MRLAARAFPAAPLLAVLAAGAVPGGTAAAETGAAGGAEKRTKAVLPKREKGPYENPAYSFFFASRDPKVHRNFADLLFNNCGLVHFNAYAGSKNRVAPLGEVEYASVRAVPEHGWLKTAFLPKKGQVFVFDGGVAASGGIEKYAVKFRVTGVDAKSVAIEWTPLGEMPKPPGRTSGAGGPGAVGLCGTPPHGEE